MQNLPTGEKGHGPIAAEKYERFLQEKIQSGYVMFVAMTNSAS